MKQKLLKWAAVIAILAWTAFITPQMSSVAAEENDNDMINEDYKDQLSLQPIAPAFNVDSLLDWSPEDDPDAELNRASVPLDKERFKGSKVNPLATKEAGVTAASITLPDHDTSSSVGSNDFNTYAFDNWQLLDSYIYWPGAENEEGIFSLPSPDIVDAAHRNGVPVYASIGFPWGEGDPETLNEIEDFTQQADDGSFPVADKMIEAAEYYGFDGYFYNQETSGVSEETAKRMNEMMRYIKRESDLRINWYDAQANDGSISYQNAVNDKNDRYVKPAKDGIYSVDEMFLNYDWGDEEIDKTVDTMKKYDRNPFDAYAGFELQQNAYHTDIDTDALLDDQDQSRTSIALYTPNSTMGLADDPVDFHKKEQQLWTGPQGDPTKADDSDDWKGMARFVADSSVISSKPFTTNFNSGHGKQYAADGKQVSSKEWNNRSVQDIMPTWRWWIRNKGSKLDASYDFDKAYNGGNSLQFSGDLKSGSVNNIMLYSTKLSIKDTTKIRVVYQSKPGADISLGVAYDEDYSEDEMKYFPLTGEEDGWNTAEIELGEDAGKTAYALSLKVDNADELEDYKLNVGQISVYDEKAQAVSEPQNPEVDEKMLRSATTAEARLSWNENDDARLYEVYQENKDGEQEFLGSTTNHYFYASDITRSAENTSDDNKTTLKIIPVTQNYERGKSAEVDFDWGVDTDATEKDEDQTSSNVARNAKVTDVSEENSTEPATDAIDGKSNTKWAATDEDDGYMTIDIGEKKTIKRWRVEHAEFGGEDKDMNTKDFELLYKDQDSNWNTAKKITDNEDAVTDVILDEPVKAQEFKLKIHDSGSSPWEAIRINEWQMFESDELPKTDNIMMHFVTAENNPGANDKVTLENVKEDQTVRLYQSLKTDDVLAEKEADEDGKMTFEDLDFGADSGRIYYTVQDENIRESLRYSTSYDGEDITLSDLIESVEQFAGNDAFADKEIIHVLKQHLEAVEHFADQDKTEKVWKHLNGFKQLLKQKEKEDQLNKKAYKSLIEQTDRLFRLYEDKNDK